VGVHIDHPRQAERRPDLPYLGGLVFVGHGPSSSRRASSG
jgi:hypothetical protein